MFCYQSCWQMPKKFCWFLMLEWNVGERGGSRARASSIWRWNVTAISLQHSGLNSRWILALLEWKIEAGHRDRRERSRSSCCLKISNIFGHASLSNTGNIFAGFVASSGKTGFITTSCKETGEQWMKQWKTYWDSLLLLCLFCLHVCFFTYPQESHLLQWVLFTHVL